MQTFSFGGTFVDDACVRVTCGDLVGSTKSDEHATSVHPISKRHGEKTRDISGYTGYGEASLTLQGSHLVAKTPQSGRISNKIDRDMLAREHFYAKLSWVA